MGVSCPADFARNDATPCTPGTTCNSQTCCVSFCSVPSNLGKTCNDNNPATFNDVCVAGGSCQGTQATCSNQNVQCPSGFAYPSSVPACTPGVNCNAATCCVAQPTLRVSSLVIKYITNAQGRYIYQATATVVNQSNGVMGNVKVTGNFRIGGATLTAQTANSNTSGVTVINTTNTWARLNQKDPRATFCVTNLVLSGYTYTPGSYCATVL
jgi:hypothetical protein